VVAVALLAPPAAGAATGAIEGTVVGPGGTPIAEVWACAYRIDGDVFVTRCDDASADGAYSLPNLSAGEYTVEFWSEAVEPSYVGEFYDDESFWEEADEVKVLEGAVTSDIDAELAEAATIKGVVNAASVGGPVEDVLVCAQLPTREFVGCTITESDGSYTLPGLSADEYKVLFTPASPAYNLLNQFYDHESTWDDADPIALAAGETKAGIDADLEAGAEIRGTVYSAATGAPVPAVGVCALFMEEEGDDWLLRECVPTSNTGSYTLRALWTDSFKVAFSSELREFFGEEFFEPERDGYLTQYFDRKPTLLAADPLSLIAPEVRTGVDAHLQPEARFPPPLVFSPAPIVMGALPKIRKRCRPGFKKKKLAGKRRCMKVRKHRGHRR
jgi:hypothetical protein